MTPRRSPATVLLASVLLVAACSKKSDTAKKEQPKPIATAQVAEAAPSVTAEIKPANLAKPELPPIDPEKVPVDEDFAKDAEWRITRTTNLEKELRRLEAEVAQRGSGDAPVATKAAPSAE